MENEPVKGWLSVPAHNWSRVLGVVLFSVLTLVLEVKNYGGYAIGAFFVTEGFVKVHGFIFGLPIGDKTTDYNLPDKPEHQTARLWVVIFGFAGMALGIVMISMYTLK